MQVKHFIVVAAAIVVVALPFIFKHSQPSLSVPHDDTPELIIITPHNEAIRREFAAGFAKWHQAKYGTAIRVDWRMMGGTTEIMRYLASEYAASARRFSQRHGYTWQGDSSAVLLSAQPPENPEARSLWEAVRQSDNPEEITCRIDLFFGGGVYDHSRAEHQGLTVPAWGKEGAPLGLFADQAGRVLIPQSMNGEVWYGKAYYGTVLSSFGICYNLDRLADMQIPQPPSAWQDLTDPGYWGVLGLADPSKSGSVAKAYEMLIHEQCSRAVLAAGFERQQVQELEQQLQDKKITLRDLPSAYTGALTAGWLKGIHLMQLIGANARYFSDVSGKVPIDVQTGAAAAGVVIDFYGRLQAEMSTPPDSQPVMHYITPPGGSGVNADPISLLRGAPHRQLAQRFIEFVLGEAGQKLWCYRAGSPGGPERFTLRRLPIRRDFYPSDDPLLQARFEAHKPWLSDPLWDPEVDAYKLGRSYLYIPRWTARHFNIQRDLIRAMCIDSGDELRRAWGTIIAHGGVECNLEAMAVLQQMPADPVPLTWESAVAVYAPMPRMQLLRNWTEFFRQQYCQAERMVLEKAKTRPAQ